MPRQSGPWVLLLVRYVSVRLIGKVGILGERFRADFPKGKLDVHMRVHTGEV